MSKTTIVTGFYGVGKTEFCVNLALNIRSKTDEPVSIADLDVINTYFRSREKSEFLLKQNISILGNTTNNTTNHDLPSISGNLIKPIANNEFLIIDLAGSKNGLKVLPTFKPYFDIHLKEFDFLMTLNVFRPPCTDFNAILNFIRDTELITGYRINGLVNNTNLIHDTTADDYLKGLEIIVDFSKKLQLPIKYTLVNREIFDILDKHIIGEPIIFNSPVMRESWL